jgi:hypothetical protein
MSIVVLHSPIALSRQPQYVPLTPIVDCCPKTKFPACQVPCIVQVYKCSVVRWFNGTWVRLNLLALGETHHMRHSPDLISAAAQHLF